MSSFDPAMFYTDLERRLRFDALPMEDFKKFHHQQKPQVCTHLCYKRVNERDIKALMNTAKFEDVTLNHKN